MKFEIYSNAICQGVIVVRKNCMKLLKKNSQWMWLHYHIINVLNGHRHIHTSTLLTKRWHLYFVILWLPRYRHFVIPLWNHHDKFLSHLRLVAKPWLHNDVDTTDFSHHVTVMWKLRVAYGSRYFHILVNFGSWRPKLLHGDQNYSNFIQTYQNFVT